jgi:hypothetical protein
LASLGLVARGLGDPDEAHRYLAEALRTAAGIGAFLPLLFALPLAALLLADQGQIERAVEVYALAVRYPFVANSEWVEAVFGRPLATIAADLSAAQVAAAQERGQNREAWSTVAELVAEMSK